MEWVKRVFRFEYWRVVADWGEGIQRGGLRGWVPLEGAEAGVEIGTE